MTSVRRAQGRRGQRGASLVLVLALTAFLGVLLPVMLGLTTTGSLATLPILEDREELYAATSAIEAAIEQGRTNFDVGMPGSDVCPEWTLELGETQIDLECFGPPLVAGCTFEQNRFVTYRATTPGGEVLAGAEVIYPADLTLQSAPFVVEWTTGETASDSPPEPLCATNPGGGGDGVIIIDPGVRWEEIRAVSRRLDESEPAIPTGWRAEGAVVVANAQGAALSGVDVTVRFEYLPPVEEPPEPEVPEDPAEPPEQVWVEDPARVTVSTTDAGRANFFSSTYALTDDPANAVVAAVAVRMIIVSIVDADGPITGAADIAVEIPSPLPESESLP